jgi:hypothetical protein
VTVDELLTSMNEFGFEDTDISEKTNALNFAIKNITQRKLWSFLDTVVTLTFSGSSATPSNVPSDLRAVRKMIDNATGRRIRFKRTDDMEEQYGTTLTQSGDPYFYYFEGRTLKVYQVPSATTTARLRYARFAGKVQSGDPESSIIVPPDGHEAVLFRALQHLYDLEDDSELAQRFEAKAENSIALLAETFEVLQTDEAEYIHVVDDDDWYDDFYH